MKFKIDETFPLKYVPMHRDRREKCRKLRYYRNLIKMPFFLAVEILNLFIRFYFKSNPGFPYPLFWNYYSFGLFLIYCYLFYRVLRLIIDTKTETHIPQKCFGSLLESVVVLDVSLFLVP